MGRAHEKVGWHLVLGRTGYTLSGGEEMDYAMGGSLISHTANIMLKMEDFRLWENGNPILLLFAFFLLAKICGFGYLRRGECRIAHAGGGGQSSRF